LKEIDVSKRTETFSKRRLPLHGLVAAAFLVGAGSAASAAEAKVTEVNIGSYSKAVDYAPYLVAKSKGWFDEAFGRAGNKVNYTEFQETPAITEAFGSDRADFVLLAEVPALVVKASKIDVRTTSISSVIGTTIVVPTDSPIKTIADLKGKKIAILIGTGENYGLLKALADNGLGVNDVQLLNLGPADGKAAFEQGQVDAWAVWPPFPEQEEVNGKGRVLPGGEGVKVYSIAIARGAVIDKNPELETTFEAVLDRGRAWVAANQDEARKITGEQLGFSADVIGRAWARNDFTAKLTADLAADFQAKADFLYDGGFVTRRVDVVGEKFLSAPATTQ
jgi:sulfonate transport system substrate-binding protein